MKPFSCLPVLVLFIVSCHNNEAAHPSVSLTENNMYSIDTVRLVANTGDEKAATRLIQEAAAKLKKGDTTGCIATFKDAVRRYPTAKAYFDLGGALVTARYYTESFEALNTAERLDYKPTANLMARYALAYSRRDDGVGHPSTDAIRYMELAIQMGYAHPREFLQPNLYPNLSGTDQFDAIYTAAVSGGPGTDADKGLWDGFEHQFTEMQLPLTIDRKWMENNAHNPPISLQYEKYIPEMRDAHFAREESYDYYYVGLIHNDAHYIAVLYSMRMNSADGDEAYLYTLVSYDHHGKIIDLLPVAGQKNRRDEFRVFTIKPDLQFQVQEFETLYKQDPQDAGYDSTNIRGTRPSTPTQYHITNAGKFVRPNPGG